MKRKTVQQDVDQELRFHLEERERELVEGGMPPQQARTESHRVFGNERRIRRQCQAIASTTNKQKGWARMIDSLRQDVTFAIRTLRRAPVFAAVAIVTLALGIGANTVIFSVVNGVLLRPLPYPEPDRLVTIWERISGDGDNHVTWANFADWQGRARSFEAMAVHPSYAFGGASTVIGGDQPMRLFVAAVSGDFFRTMGVEPIIGRSLGPEDHVEGAAAAVVVSHGFWQTQLGSAEDLASRPLTMGSDIYQVVGVAPPGFRFPARTDLWIATERFGSNDSRTSHNHAVIGRLRPGVSVEEARQELDTITAALKDEFGDDMNAVGVNVRSLADELVGSSRQPLYMLLGAAGLVLLVACTNLASTLLARGSNRRREIAIRASVGAGRGRLVAQMLIESLTLALSGAAAGALLSVVVLRGLVDASPALPRPEAVGIDPGVLAFTGVVTVLTAILFGLFPALVAARGGGAGTLRAGERGASSSSRSLLWRGLVSVEVAMVLILLVGAGLLIQSFATVMAIDPGLDPAGVLTVDIAVPSANHPDDEALTAFYDRLLGSIDALPGVEGSAVINHLPLLGMWINGGFLIDGRGDVQPAAHYRAVTGAYFEVMGVPVLRGRTFSDADRHGAPGVVVVNEAFAEYYFPGDDAVGNRVGSLSNDAWVYGDEWLTIVGVVGDVRHGGLTSEPVREIYVNARQRPMRVRSSTLVVKTGGASADLVGPVRGALQAIDPEVPSRFATMEAIVGDSTADRRFLMIVLGTFAATALTLAMVGIYGVVSYSVARRMREMGIRIALGAEPRKVRNLVIGRAMVMIVAGIALGIVGALSLTGVLDSLLYEVDRLDPAVFAAVIVVLLAAAWLASLVPALRGSRVDPIVTMRSE